MANVVFAIGFVVPYHKADIVSSIVGKGVDRIGGVGLCLIAKVPKVVIASF